jgi:hypothetical protein
MLLIISNEQTFYWVVPMSTLDEKFQTIHDKQVAKIFVS